MEDRQGRYTAIFCNNCGIKLPDGTKYCSHCGATLNTNQNVQYPLQVQPKSNQPTDTPKKKNYLWVNIIVISIGLLVFSKLATPTPTPDSTNESIDTDTQANPESTQITGIIGAEFNKKAYSQIKAINIDDMFARIESEVRGDFAYVKLHLSSISGSVSTSDTSKKELLNSIGGLLDSIASSNVYPDTGAIGVSIKIISPSGLELAERTVWGNIKLK